MAASFLEDGFTTLLTFSAGSISMEEVSTTPPGLEAGEKINTTTFRNTAWRTYALRQLVDMSDGSVTVKYKPTVYTEILAMLGVNQQITVTFSDGSSIQFWGGINSFVPGEAVEGQMPTAQCALIATNRNDSGAETAPTVTKAV